MTHQEPGGWLANLVIRAQMPPRKHRITLRQFGVAIRWAVLVVLVGAPLSLGPRLLLSNGPNPAVWLPGEIGRSVVGIVDAVTEGGRATAAKPSQSAHQTAVGSISRRHAAATAAAGSHTLVPVVTTACTSCRVLHDSTTGAIRVTLGSAQRRAAGSAFALLDFGGLGGAGGVVRVHDRIGLDRGQVPQSDLSVLQVTDVDNRVAYRLQIDRMTRVLRLVSPPGGLGRSGLNASTGMAVPDDGVRTLTVDVAAQAGRSLVVQVNGRTVISKQGLSGGNALRQRYLAVGILNTPAGMSTLSVTHDELQVGLGSAAGGDQSGVTTSGIDLSPAVTLVPPGNLAPPTITGDAVAGQPLTASLGSWSDAKSVRVRWSSCAGDGTGCQQIANANGTTYVPGSSDAGSTFLITVTASNDAGTAVAASGITPIVANFKPVLLTAPSITGDLGEGATLTASPGTWAWRNGTFGYAWQRCDANGANCTTITGETGSTLALGHDDVGSTIRVLVTAPGLTTSTTAAASATDAVLPAAPRNLALPIVTGNAVTGALLTATTGSWTDSSASYVYAWSRCSADGVCIAISGAGGDAYNVGVEDLGRAIQVTVTATNAGGVGTASSTATAAVASGAPTSTARSAISGDTVVGSTLTLSTGTWSDPQATISISWQRCTADFSSCSTIVGATATSYVLTADDAGSIIEAVVTAANNGGSATDTSAATAPIAAAPAPPPAPPTSSTPPAITGDTVVGSTLTLSTGAWSDPQATISITWQRCTADATSCTTIDGATADTYVLTADDAGSTIEAVVTAVDNGGSATATAGATAPITEAPAPPAPPAPPADATPPDAGATPLSTETAP